MNEGPVRVPFDSNCILTEDVSFTGGEVVVPSGEGFRKRRNWAKKSSLSSEGGNFQQMSALSDDAATNLTECTTDITPVSYIINQLTLLKQQIT